jgi:hypothetical protein
MKLGCQNVKSTEDDQGVSKVEQPRSGLESKQKKRL